MGHQQIVICCYLFDIDLLLGIVTIIWVICTILFKCTNAIITGIRFRFSNPGLDQTQPVTGNPGTRDSPTHYQHLIAAT